VGGAGSQPQAHGHVQAAAANRPRTHLSDADVVQIFVAKYQMPSRQRAAGILLSLSLYLSVSRARVRALSRSLALSLARSLFKACVYD
jgi:hypothetical protein